MKSIILIFTIFLTLSGCASNPFSKFYTDRIGGRDVTKLNHVILPTSEPVVFRGGEVHEEDSIAMMEKGYIMLGFSSFNAGNVNENNVKTQAKKVHASAVVLYSKYTNTVSGSMPLTLPNTTTTNTSVYGNVYGSGGYVNVSGSGTSTTYGTKTTYIPYSVRRSDYGATYWIKAKTPTFGLIPRDLKADARKIIGTNKGVRAYAIVSKSPAFYADIFKGDILLKIGDADIYDGETYTSALKKYSGQKVDVHIYRDKKTILKNVQFNVRH